MHQINYTADKSKLLLAFGVVLPIVAVIFDPYVFRGQGLLSNWAGAGYSLILIGICVMSYWLTYPRNSPFFAGIFITCSLLSSAVGIFLLIPSLIGIMFFGIGILGLIPFGTAYVFWKASVLAWNKEPLIIQPVLQYTAGILVLLTAIAACQTAGVTILKEATNIFVEGQSQTKAGASFLLNIAEPFDLQRNIVKAWRDELDAVRAKEIATNYEKRYGTKIDFDEIMFFD